MENKYPLPKNRKSSYFYIEQRTTPPGVVRYLFIYLNKLILVFVEEIYIY